MTTTRAKPQRLHPDARKGDAARHRLFCCAHVCCAHECATRLLHASCERGVIRFSDSSEIFSADAFQIHSSVSKAWQKAALNTVFCGTSPLAYDLLHIGSAQLMRSSAHTRAHFFLEVVMAGKGNQSGGKRGSSSRGSSMDDSNKRSASSRSGGRSSGAAQSASSRSGSSGRKNGSSTDR